MVKLRYLGTSGRFHDPVSGVTFIRDGEPHEIEKSRADQLVGLTPFDFFEEVGYSAPKREPEPEYENDYEQGHNDEDAPSQKPSFPWFSDND